ncbi:hypothetical protein DM785_16835 (plasmid) [Deinococcus actinosclerus]|nr:hypothetical protein DM785_16835 [Deinococcus actinosclerus]
MSTDPAVLTRLQALAARADALRPRCPYRFSGMSPEAVRAWLDREYIPEVLGWSPVDVQRLGPLLGRPIPAEYQVFLEVLGFLHPRLYGYDHRLRTPEDHLVLQQDLLEWDGANWDGVQDDPAFEPMVTSGIFLNTLGGFAVWYLPGNEPGPLHTLAWEEGDGTTPGQIGRVGLFLDDLEARMRGFERRVALYEELGGTLVYGRGSQVPLGRTLGTALVDLPHEAWQVQLSEDQRAQIRSIWKGVGV